MATISSAPGVSLSRGTTRTDINELLIRLAHRSIAGAIVGLILFLSVHGASYYRLSALDRSASPLYDQLRSSGTIGLSWDSSPSRCSAASFFTPSERGSGPWRG